MRDEDKTKEQLIAELRELRQRVAADEVTGRRGDARRESPTSVATHGEDQQERDRLRAILSAAIECLPFDFFALGADGRCILQNAVSRQYYGDALGRTTEEVCPDPRIVVRWLENNRRAFAGERVEGEVELVVLGERRHFYNIINPIRDGKTVYGILGVNVDITERKRAEEALRESEKRFRLLAENASDIIYRYRLSPTPGFDYISPAVKEIFGFTPEEVYADPDLVLTIAHPDARERETAIRSMLRDSSKPFAGPFVTKCVRQDGTVFWVERRITLIRDEDDRLIAFEGVSRDITERVRAELALKAAHDELERRVEQRTADLAAANEQLKREIEVRKKAEEDLRQSHGELRAIYEGMGDGLVICDIETVKAVRVNSAFCQMLGYSEEELLALPVDRLHPPEDFSRIQEQAGAVIQGRASRFEDMPFLRKDSSIAYADVVANQIAYNGRPCLISFFRDVTERRQARIALERERRSLEHMLRASDHERQLIAYDIHDGLAQELAGAIMQFQIHDQLKGSKPDEAKKAYDGGVTLLRQGHSEVRRIISGVRPPILDESGVMAAISHLIHDPTFDHGPKIEFRSRVKFARLDPVMENIIYRIVQEGLSNARAHSKSKRIVVSLVQRSELLRIEVRDWGVGFDPTRAQENRFGLEGIRERARLLGGRCRLRSRSGQGTSIVVELQLIERRGEE